MELTKEQATIEHRKMWNWIAEQYKSGNIDNIADLKSNYLSQYDDGKWLHIPYGCFCCAYDTCERGKRGGETCEYCPVEWGSNVDKYMCCDRYVEDDRCGLYGYLYYLSITSTRDPQELAKLAEEIANLPEREIPCV